MVDYGPQSLASCLFRVLQALLQWQTGEDRSHKCTSHVHWDRVDCCLLLPLKASPYCNSRSGLCLWMPSGSPRCGAALAETEMHTLNSTCIKNCLPRGTECPVLSLNKCHMSYAMYSNLYPYSTCSTRLNSHHFFLSSSLPLSLQSLTLYQYLKCNLSLSKVNDCCDVCTEKLRD